MKKPFLFLALTGGIGAACAQSTVTVFGIVDVTLSRGVGSISSRNQMLRSGLHGARLGFRGEEDIGGGTYVGFWLESGFNPDDGTGLATNTNNQPTGASAGQGLTFGRRSTVSVRGSFGELRLGRDYTPQYWNYLSGDPFLTAGVGSAVNFTSSITGVTAVRASNSIGYYSPKTAGFVLQAMHYLGENPGGAPNSSDGNGDGIRLSYEGGPVTAGISTSRTKYVAGDVRQSNVNFNYNFGMATALLTYSTDRNGPVSAKGHIVGVTVPVGVGNIKAAYSRHQTDAAGSPDAKKFALGYDHWLSKRTALYATLARVSNSGGLSVSLNGASTAANASSSGFDLGVRHGF